MSRYIFSAPSADTDMDVLSCILPVRNLRTFLLLAVHTTHDLGSHTLCLTKSSCYNTTSVRRHQGRREKTACGGPNPLWIQTMRPTFIWSASTSLLPVGIHPLVYPSTRLSIHIYVHPFYSSINTTFHFSFDSVKNKLGKIHVSKLQGSLIIWLRLNKNK